MDNQRTRFESALYKRKALKAVESAGQVADSLDVRRALMEQVHAGEITLAQAQTELKQIQDGAKCAGMMTRAQAFSRG